MNRNLIAFCFFIFACYSSFSQGVGIGTVTPDNSAILDITATNRGLLIPRMNTTSINAIVNPAKGLLVYDSVSNLFMVNIGNPAIPDWQPLSSDNSGWGLNGNAGTNALNQFLGTTDNRPLLFRINNIQAGELNPVNGNIFWGLRAGQSNTSGFSNIAIGGDALKFNTNASNLTAIGDSALFNNGQGRSAPNESVSNTAIGSKTLFSNTRGAFNTAVGTASLFSNATGTDNSAVGAGSLFFNSTGAFNTAVGVDALALNTVGNVNTAIGWRSLHSNISGNNNVAAGWKSLFNNSVGHDNTALGSESLFSNSLGNNNTSIGSQSLLANTIGNNNTAIGEGSLISNKSGEDNTAIGVSAMSSNNQGNKNIAIGNLALKANTTGVSNISIGFNTLSNTNGSNNTVIGDNAGNLGAFGSDNVLIGAGAGADVNFLSNSIAIGTNARVTDFNQVRLGNLNTQSIGGVVGFTNLSDGRFKTNVRENVKGLDFIMKLRPVTYQLDIAGLNTKLKIKTDTNKNGSSRFQMDENSKTIFTGFVAQEVEQAAKDVNYDFSGVDKPNNENGLYGLRYSEFVVPLVKAVQEQQQTIDTLTKRIEKLESMIGIKK